MVEEYNGASTSLEAYKPLYSICHSFLTPNTQHDAQEFIRRLLGKLQDEINSNKKYVFPDEVSVSKAWRIYRDANESSIDGMLAGMICSTVTCKKCHYNSDTFDPILDLSISVRKSTKTLESCLEKYFEKEAIDCDYKCSKCSKTTAV